MTEEEKQAHAIRIAEVILSDVNGFTGYAVYDDPALNADLPLSEKDSEDIIEDIVEIICTELKAVFRG